MPAACRWTIQIFIPGQSHKVIEGTGKACKESELRRICTETAQSTGGEVWVTETAQSTGGEVWVTETGARAWEVWDCRKGDRFGCRGRVVPKA